MRLPRINSFKSDPTGWIGSGVMLAFGLIALWRWSESGLLFFALTALRDIAAAWFLIRRNPVRVRSQTRFAAVLAYASSAVPCAYLGSLSLDSPVKEASASILAIIGFALATIALFEIGTSFGISPASRDLVRSGIYRYLRHPMYCGYAIAEGGLVLLNSANGILFSLSVALYAARAILENRLRVITLAAPKSEMSMPIT